MIADPDEDDALSWAGETDPSHVAGPPAAEKPKPKTEVIVDAPAKPATSAIVLVSYGILAGAYLIYTIGWVVSVQRLNAAQATSSEVLNAIMFGLGEILAMASPAIWFGATFLLTRGRKPVARLLWILVGLIAVLPWPFVLGAWI
ncbi:MAG: hypothetical protein JWP19_625 [Rhodoglobus sp.]|jgi:hypothetical protein|nr:hypothetical protein [Rhodoglobus sp.]